MQSTWFKKVLPHLVAIVIFLVVAVIYCAPALQGKVLDQHDMIGWKGMAQQSFEFKEKYGHMPLWSNSMFGGMPAYTFAGDAPAIQLIYLQIILTLGLPAPISYFFLACICFYFLCQVLRIRPVLSILGAIAFAYSTYDPIIVAVGHVTKMTAIAYMPAVIASVLLLFKRKFWTGSASLIISFGLMTATQHLQIIYYTLIILGVLSIAYIIKQTKKGGFVTTIKPLALAAVCGIIGLCSFARTIFPLQEYAKETMRGGKSDLTIGNDKDNKTQGGLDKDYAFGWSYGIGETFTLIVPNAYGGSSPTVINNQLKSEFGDNTKTAKTLEETTGMPEEQANNFVKQLPAYWGAQPSTSGPVYLGAIIVFLFIFGSIYLKSWHKWWIIPVTVIGIMLAWGKNFSSLNYFLFDYLPFYNKFRAPSMSLIIPQLTFPLLAVLSLEQFFSSSESKVSIWKPFKLSVIVSGIVIGCLVIFYFSSDFKGPNDNDLSTNLSSMMLQQAGGQNASPQVQQQAAEFGRKVVHSLQDDRRSLFGSDLLRSIILIVLAAGLIGAYLKNKINAQFVLISLLILSSFDLLAIGRRYLNNENFTDKDEFETALQPTAADLQIMKDTNLPFRVFDQTDPQGPFQGSRASYFFNSIGGYSPAKLGLYQDIIEHQLSKGNQQVFNMLNTRYYISAGANQQPVANINPDAFGPCWFVKSIKYVNNSDEEMKALDSTQLRDVAVVQKKYQSAIKGEQVYDSTASITWLENLNDEVKYKTSAKTNQFAVFSEIYYDKGWNAYIDGQKADYVKADYVLRGMFVPAGEHSIVFKFEPTVIKRSNIIMVTSSLIGIILLILAFVLSYRKKEVV